MTPSPQGLALVAQFEGFRPNAYLCPAGVPTIGYGFTEGVKLGDTMTQKAATARLLVELTHFAGSVYAFCSASVTQSQLDAMTSLAYNIGLTAFARSSVLRMHNIGAAEACGRAFSLWTKVDGQVLRGLTTRRTKEAALYLSTEK